MKPPFRKSDSPFVGQFCITMVHCRGVTGEWQPYEGFVEGQEWVFIETSNQNLVDDVINKGILLELNEGVLYDITEYAYFEEDKTLYIDRSSYYDDGCVDICWNDRYRVEKVGDHKFRLFNLEDVKNEPHDYHLKMSLDKILF